MSAPAYVSELERRADVDLARLERLAQHRNSQDSQDSQGVEPIDAPEPLRRPTAPPAPYPVDALGPLLGPAASTLHRVVQSPAAICGQSILAAASLAAQPHADVAIDGRRPPLSLFLLTIAESGERKSATDGPALRPHREIERERVEEYRRLLSEHEQAMALHESEVSAAKRQKNGRADAIAACGSPPDAPLLPHLTCGEPTLEGLHKLLIHGRGAVGLFSDDGGQFVGGHAMNKDNAAKTIAGMCLLWDRGEADRIRAGDGATKLYGRRVALHLLIQPVIAERVLSDPLLVGQGFLARCLIAWPDTTAGSRPYVATDLTHDPAMTAYGRTMRDLLERAPTLRAGTRNEMEPRGLALAPSAKELWVKAHDAIERRMKSGGEYELVRPLAGKAAEQILRIAGVLTVVADPDAGSIDRHAIEAAAALVDFHLGEAARLQGTAAIAPDIRSAEALLAWAHGSGIHHLHSSKALQFGPACIRDRTRFVRVMDLLEQARWAIRVEGGMELDGAHRRNVWTVRRGAGG